MPTLNELYSKYGQDGLVVLGVHSDPDTAQGLKAVSELKIAYPVAFDGGKLMDAVGGQAFPTLLLVDRKGILRVFDVPEDQLDKAVTRLLSEKAD